MEFFGTLFEKVNIPSYRRNARFLFGTSARRTTLLPSGQMTWSTCDRTLSKVSSGVRKLAWTHRAGPYTPLLHSNKGVRYIPLLLPFALRHTEQDHTHHYCIQTRELGTFPYCCRLHRDTQSRTIHTITAFKQGRQVHAVTAAVCTETYRAGPYTPLLHSNKGGRYIPLLLPFALRHTEQDHTHHYCFQTRESGRFPYCCRLH